VRWIVDDIGSGELETEEPVLLQLVPPARILLTIAIGGMAESTVTS
jgi:hypothetical protein